MAWKPRIAGIIPPLVTPLNDRQELDREALTRLLNHVVEQGGVHGLFLLGTTGEGPHLPHACRQQLVSEVCQRIESDIPVLVNVSETSVADAVEMAEFAADQGAAAVVSTRPSYLPLTADDEWRYFTSLADASPLPLLLYDIPLCTHVGLCESTFVRCLEHDNIVGVKDSRCDLDALARLVNLAEARPDWSVLVGPEELLVRAIEIGAHGAVCGGANLAPRLFLALADAAIRGDLDELETLRRQQELVAGIYQAAGGVERAGFVRGIKFALAALGICDNVVSEPFEALPRESGSDVLDALESLELLAVR